MMKESTESVIYLKKKTAFTSICNNYDFTTWLIEQSNVDT